MHVIAKVIATMDNYIPTFTSICTSVYMGYIIHTHEFIRLFTCMQVYLRDLFCSQRRNLFENTLEILFYQKIFKIMTQYVFQMEIAFSNVRRNSKYIVTNNEISG